MPRFIAALTVALVAALAAATPGPVQAALGGDVASVLRDHEAIRATHTVTVTLSYDVHEGTNPDGLRLREYVDRSGKVFAVSWQGVRSPDVGALLGTYAARYHATARNHRGHHVLSIADPDLVVTVMRLPRGWTGHAYVPAAVPPGVDRAELR